MQIPWCCRTSTSCFGFHLHLRPSLDRANRKNKKQLRRAVLFGLGDELLFALPFLLGPIVMGPLSKPAGETHILKGRILGLSEWILSHLINRHILVQRHMQTPQSTQYYGRFSLAGFKGDLSLEIYACFPWDVYAFASCALGTLNCLAHLPSELVYKPSDSLGFGILLVVWWVPKGFLCCILLGC